MDNQELLHWGIKGMKWGVRRYQNKDGSLTPEGRKRYNEGSDGSSSKGEKKADTGSRKKSVKEMSDEELMKAINRARLEDTYKSLRPEEVSAGKKIASKFLNEAVVPAAVNAGKQFLENSLKKLSKELLKDAADPDDIAGLEKMVKKLELQKKLKNLKNGVDDMSWDDKLKKQQYEKNKRAEEAEAAAKADKEKKTSSDSDSTKDSGKTSEKKTSGSDSFDSSKVHTGTVFGEGTSKGSQSRKEGEKWWKTSDFQDVNYTTAKNSSTTKAGKDYTDDWMNDNSETRLWLTYGLLEDPNKKK